MTLCTRVAFVRGAGTPAVLLTMAGSALVGFALRHPAGGIFGAFIGGAIANNAWRPLSTRLLRRIFEQHQAGIDAALDEGDEEAQRRLMAELDDYYRRYTPQPAWLPRVRHRAHMLATDEQWSEALAMIAQIDRDAIPPNERALHDNLVAWCCAHAGETARAVEIARANVNALADAATGPFLLGTLGCALVLDGQHAAALAPLRDAIALGGPRWAQAVRHLYLGDALAALGRLDEARAEWQHAVAIAPRSRWGRRAQERLDSGAPAAYR